MWNMSSIRWPKLKHEEHFCVPHKSMKHMFNFFSKPKFEECLASIMQGRRWTFIFFVPHYRCAILKAEFMEGIQHWVLIEQEFFRCFDKLENNFHYGFDTHMKGTSNAGSGYSNTLQEVGRMKRNIILQKFRNRILDLYMYSWSVSDVLFFHASDQIYWRHCFPNI